MAHDTTSFLRLLAQAEDATGQERWPDAARFWTQVVEANPVDGRFWLELANAHVQLDDHVAAIAPLEQVLALRHEFPPETMVRLARCHIHLGHEETALNWIERAVAGGYSDLPSLADGDDFAALRPSSRFRDLIGLIDDSWDMSRDDRWRHDLRFAAPARSSGAPTPPSASSPNRGSMPWWTASTRRFPTSATTGSSLSS